MCEDHVAGADDDCPESAGVEGAAHVGRPASLLAEAGHQDPRVGHGGAEFVELPRPGGADDGPDGPVRAARGGSRGELFHAGGHVFVDRAAVGLEILKILAAGVRGLHEDEDAGAAVRGDLHEGLDRVEAEVGVHGEGVGGPGAGEPAVGVGLGGGADVAPLAVGEHKQVFRAGVGDHLGERGHAIRPDRLEAGQLRLHDRHQRRDDVDHVAAEPREDGGEGLGVGGGRRMEGGGERFAAGVEPDAGGRAPLFDGSGEPGGKSRGGGRVG